MGTADLDQLRPSRCKCEPRTNADEREPVRPAITAATAASSRWWRFPAPQCLHLGSSTGVWCRTGGARTQERHNNATSQPNAPPFRFLVKFSQPCRDEWGATNSKGRARFRRALLLRFSSLMFWNRSSEQAINSALRKPLVSTFLRDRREKRS